MSETEYDKILDKAIEELPREAEPNRDLWPDVESTINARAEKKSVINYRVVAFSLMMVVGVTVGLFFVEKPREKESEAIATVFIEMDRGFEITKAGLLESFKNKEALTSNWKEQIEELEFARRSIKKSLTDDPKNIYLLKILQNIHSQQISLIERVHDHRQQSI